MCPLRRRLDSSSAMHMGSLVIANLIWSLMGQLGNSQSIYHCKTKEELDEYRDGQRLHRFLVHRNTIYLVLKSRIVSFKAPYTETDANGEVHLVNSLPFAYEHNEKDTSKKVIGYMAVNDFTYELYTSKVPNRFIGYELDFDSNLAGKKESNYIYLTVNVTDDSESCIFAYQVNKQYMVMFVYRDSAMDFYYFQMPESAYEFLEPAIVNRTITLGYRVRYAVFYKKGNEKEKQNRQPDRSASEKSEYFLVELDHEMNLRVRRVELPNPQRQHMEPTLHKSSSIELSHLLSCHQPFDQPSQVKGVYHDPENELFFVFIDRFYFETRDNLVKCGFDLLPKYFETALDITFDKNLKHILKFRNSVTKWIKVLRYQAFLVASNRSFPVESPTIKNGFFEYKNDYVTGILTQCEGQTLEIGDVIFCFDQHTYTSMDGSASSSDENPRYPIEQIFANTRIDYSNQTLELIFNFHEAFVLMTRTCLFVVNYRLANLENGKKSIAISDGPKDKLYRVKNRLFLGIPNYRLAIQPVEKALFIVIFVLIPLMFGGVIYRVIEHRKRLAENRSKEMLNFIHKTMSLRDNIRKTLNIRGPSWTSQRSKRSKRSGRSSRSSRAGSKSRSGYWARFNMSGMRRSGRRGDSYRRDRKKDVSY